VSEKLSENIQVVANEPSLAFFRIQEHVRKTLPPLTDKKVWLLVHTCTSHTDVYFELIANAVWFWARKRDFIYNIFVLLYWIVDDKYDLCFVQREVLSLQKSIQGSSFDTEYAIKYVSSCVIFWTGEWLVNT